MIIPFPCVEDPRPRVGRALQDIREGRGLSLRQLARESGVSAARLSMAQQDDVRLNSAELHAVINALHIPLELLFSPKADLSHLRKLSKDSRARG